MQEGRRAGKGNRKERDRIYKKEEKEENKGKNGKLKKYRALIE